MFDQVLWFATRGAGAVSLLMFTAATCLGLVTVTRFQAAGWPRFFNYEMHRRVSLLSIVFLAVHVLAAVFDPFTSLGLGAALVPLASTYRPLPVALGVIALYLFVALIATSLLRKHIGQRTWRLVHWSSYAMWPLAVLHGLTAGTDGWSTWMLGIDVRVRLGGRGLPRLAGHGRHAESQPASPESSRRRRWSPGASTTGRPMTVRLLAGPALTAGPESLAAHRDRLGPAPAATAICGNHGAARGVRPPGPRRSRLPRRPQVGRGRGARYGDAIVLANGAEGEPLSAKDRVLMATRPHLVLDGAELAADAVGAEWIILYVGSEHTQAIAALDARIGRAACRVAGRPGARSRSSSSPRRGPTSRARSPPPSTSSTRAMRARPRSRRDRSSAASTAGRRSSRTSRASPTPR